MEQRWQSVVKNFGLPGATLVLLAVLVGIRFAHLEEKTREGLAVGRLHQVRQAILLFYQDHNGVYPRELAANAPFGEYLKQLPVVPQLHPQAKALSPAGVEVVYGNDRPRGFGRGWYYNPDTGQFFVNSTGLDTRGISYTAY